MLGQAIGQLSGHIRRGLRKTLCYLQPGLPKLVSLKLIL